MEQQQEISQRKRKKQQLTQKRKAQTTKDILLTPYKRSWPILLPEHEKEFQDLFYSNLSKLVPAKQTKIPWSELKDIPKEQRKNIRQKHRKSINIDVNLRKSLIFGVNECTKALEKHEILAVLISSDCNPEMMVNHIIRIAGKQKIAVSIISSLKTTLKNLIGFPCVCLGFKKYEKLDNLGKLKDIVKFLYKVQNININEIVQENKEDNKILEIKSNNNTEKSTLDINPGQDSPKILNITTIQISDSPERDLDNSVQIIHDSPSQDTENTENQIAVLTEIVFSKENPENAVQDSNKIITDDIIILNDTLEPDPALNLNNSVEVIEDSIKLHEDTVLDSKNTIEMDLITNFVNNKIEAGPYLYRASTKERVFIPSKFEAPQKKVRILKNTEEFIAFGVDEYIPSIIKKIKGSNKIKKKKKKNKNKKQQKDVQK